MWSGNWSSNKRSSRKRSPRPWVSGRAIPLIRLLVGVGVIGAIWGLLLPLLGQWAPVDQFIRRLEDAGIDPSAMYYTELEMMPEVRDQLRDFRSRHPRALWTGEVVEDAAKDNSAISVR